MSTTGTILEHWERARFSVLTASLTIFVFVLLPLRDEPGEYRLLASVLFSTVLLSSIAACARRRGPMLVAALLAVPALLLVWALHHFDHQHLLLIKLSVSALVLAFTAGVVLLDVMTAPRVTFDVIIGGIGVYLLIGLTWALLYSVVYTLDPTAFVVPEHLQRSLTEGHAIGDMQVLTYYSIVTLTTLGYGEIVPISAQARGLAAFEAMIGQIYLTVLVARLVGLHLTQKGGQTTLSE